MILIADAGGTKTDWRLLDGDRIEQFKTQGYNPHTHDLDAYTGSLTETFAELATNIKKVHFYGASIYPHDIGFKEALNTVFTEAEIFPDIDLLGSCRALSNDQPAFVGILGTGSAGCFYDGDKVAIHPPSLGHALGDEGGGAILGKTLVRDAMRKKLQPDLQEHFETTFNITKFDVYEKVYGVSNANTYLASFTKFIDENKSHPQIHAMLMSEFKNYFDAYFGHLPDSDKYPFHFTGGVAIHFEGFLRDAGAELGLTVGRIVQGPIAGLALYHQKHG